MLRIEPIISPTTSACVLRHGGGLVIIKYLLPLDINFKMRSNSTIITRSFIGPLAFMVVVMLFSVNLTIFKRSKPSNYWLL